VSVGSATGNAGTGPGGSGASPFARMEGPAAAGPLARVQVLADAEVLSSLDRHLAHAVFALDGADEHAALGAALASRAVQLGHVCVDLSRFDFAELAPAGVLDAGAFPSTLELLAALRRSPLVSELGEGLADADVPTPLVLDARGRLYLQRYARYERTLAALLLARARRASDVDLALLRDGIQRLFAGKPTELGSSELALSEPGVTGARSSLKAGAHALAACVAALHSLAVICGGPGTGKTTTVVKILALLQEQALRRGERPLSVLLLAPTGKAARRLASSVQAGLVVLPVSEVVKAALPNEAFTIHRALGGGTSGRFRHDASNPLPADVVLVDEVSMVDLALLYRLVIAIRPQARLILQGDKDQLASVEAGAILGDIYEPNAAAAWSRPFAAEASALIGHALPVDREERGLVDCLVSLDESFRYRSESGIGRLARAINAGDGAGALAILRGRASLGIERSAEHGPARDAELIEAAGPASELAELERRATLGYTTFIQCRDAKEKLARLGDYRVLCAHRQGLRGVVQQNRNVEAWLAKAGLIDPLAPFYENRPIIITQNDYTLGLFNGDVGIVVKDEHDRLRVCFEGQDGIRFLAPGRLPPHETVFATTVHKSQGSEFDAVSVLLPDIPSALVGRELLYTAVTRARERVDLFAPAEVIKSAIARTVQRPSGLRDALWKS
jgi:exodeoxyribonuclease V alpha subunit